ncbi:MAG: hypothetical protein R3277_09670 [Brumimicrobium sp.]|nr:hypothetical protein [Brumimicrobium sp.]
MDAGTIITAAVLVAVVALPILMMKRSRDKIKRKLLAEVTQRAKDENSVISLHDFWGFTMLGIDNNLKKLFVARWDDDKVFQDRIELANYKVCQIFKSGFEGGRRSNPSATKVMGIRLISKDAKGQDPLIEIYNDDKDLQAEGGREFIEKWIDKINNILK